VCVNMLHLYVARAVFASGSIEEGTRRYACLLCPPFSTSNFIGLPLSVLKVETQSHVKRSIVGPPIL
jgi:hypothetical protein